MSNVPVPLSLAIAVGAVLTGLSFLYAPATTIAGCNDGASYHVHGFPVQYYQEQLPASCVNPGGPAFPDAHSDREYFGWHFYWIPFIADAFAWSAICFAAISGIRVMQRGRA